MTFNYSAFSVSFIGLLFSFFVILLNLRLLFKFSNSLLRNKHDYELFTLRFVYDIVFSASVIVYYFGLCLSYIKIFVLFDYMVYFVDALITSNIYTARYLLTFFISVERLTAVFFPINFHNFRQKFSLSLFVFSILFYGLFEDVMYFIICKVEPFEKSCSIFACTWNSCFIRYWTGNKMVIGIFSSIVSLALFFKIMFLNRRKMKSDLKKTIYLCLVDGIMIIIFDFCPFFATLVYRDNLLSADKFGPYNATIKSIACFIDASIALFILKPKNKTIVTDLHKISRHSGRDTSENTP